jgi:hypothetical protein
MAMHAEHAAQQTMDVVHGALRNYFGWLRKLQSVSPLGNSDINQTLLNYAEENVNAAFSFAHKISQAKDLQQVMAIQTEFMQGQLSAFSQRAQELGTASERIDLTGDKTTTISPSNKP